ncbi:fumarylacetoacetate hydrolase family protein [Microvirga sp. BT689]|uniref:fumarylacetoacetate hydrolase family protein n=1 Tax=Microvirga arvi TaxID=2778731 RepID=UPI00194FCA43|nr:fumarylacetoacetate hydrolase family protein [Microvirga arvi]MBM6581264.1 fumarylacetoacetate hydrolase family protein [Microvirga arvi]
MALVFPHSVTTLAIIGSEDRFPVRRIYCVGRNYVEHIREMKEGDERDLPFFFQKPTDSIVSEGEVVPYPPATEDFQYEVELVAAIGKSARNIPVAEALDVVFGYAAGIDLTRRDRQRESFKKGLPWEIGKSFDHSAPCGPLHPVDSVGHRLEGSITLSVNDEERQRADLRQMIWNTPEIIANLSTQYSLEPGDLIMTGTPAGVGPIVPGDRLVATVEGLAPFSFSIGPKKA